MGLPFHGQCPAPVFGPHIGRTSKNTYSPTFGELAALTPPAHLCQLSQKATAKRSTTVTRRGFPKRKSSACTSHPRGHCGGPEKVKVANTDHLTSFSVNGEHTSNSLSEPRGRLLRLSATPSRKGLQRGFSGFWGILAPHFSISYLRPNR